MDILYVTQKFPYPLNDWGNIRSFNILKQLARKHSVTLLSNVSSPAEATDCGELKQLCHKISTFPEKPGSRLLLANSLLHGLYGDQPYFMYKNFSAKLLAGIQAELSLRSYRAIHFNHLDTAQYIRRLPGEFICVLDTHNILSLMVQRFYRQEHNPIKKGYIYTQWRKTLSVERQLCQRMQYCLVCSENDAKELAAIAPRSQVEVIPNGVEPERPALSGAADKPSLVFIGAMDYMPNYQGILHFCEQVLPRIEQEISDIKLNIIGRNPIAAVRQLAHKPNIQLLDKVENIHSVLHPEQILVVPLKVGGGTRLKILDAMSLRLPVVATSVGAEGLALTPGEQILIADEPQEMAQQIIRLYNDNKLRERLIDNAYQCIKQQYDWNIIGERLLKLYSQWD